MAPCTWRSVKRARDCDPQLLIWQQSQLERPHLAARDLHLVPVELSHDEAVEAVVHAGGVAAERDVGGELVDLVAEGETSAAPGLQRRAVRRGLDRMRQWLRRWSL